MDDDCVEIREIEVRGERKTRILGLMVLQGWQESTRAVTLWLHASKVFGICWNCFIQVFHLRSPRRPAALCTRFFSHVAAQLRAYALAQAVKVALATIQIRSFI